MSEEKRILIACPTHNIKSYCDGEILKAIHNLKVEGQEIIIRFDPNEYGSTNACKKQREWFRRYAVEKNFSYLYFMGWDNPATTEQINKLLSLNLDVVGGIYWGRYGAENGRVDGAVCWINGLTREEQNAKMKYGNGVIKVDGMGMDSVLFSRKAFTSFSYLDWEQNDDDYPAYDILKSKGFKIYADTDVQIPHYATSNIYSLNGESITIN